MPYPFWCCVQLQFFFDFEFLFNQWKNISSGITVVQGMKDNLVPPANADFIERVASHRQPKIIRLTEQNHFLQVNENDLIERLILAEVKVL